MDIEELIKDLEEKEANKMKLTECELAVLDASRGLKKEGKKISAKTIEEIKFMMD
jgi:hypothetical protein